MGKTSWQSKAKYNKKTYKRVTADLPFDLVDRFKKKCAAEGISQASVIKTAIVNFLGDREAI